MSLVTLEGVSLVDRGRPTLSDITLTLMAGDRLGIIGEASAGKSALAGLLAGMFPDGAMTGGTFAFEGAPLPAAEPKRAALRRERIAYLPQEAALGHIPSAPVTAALDSAGLVLLGELGGDAAGLSQKLPHEIGPELCQLVALAAVLARRAPLLVLDDPLAPLGPVAQRRVLDRIERKCREEGTALVLVARDLRAISMLCPRVAVMAEGRLVEAGARETVIGHPRHAATRRLVAASRYRATTLARTPIGTPVLEVRDISRRFHPVGRPASAGARAAGLADVGFELRAGESLALVGPAGAGKTMLARIVAGLEGTGSGSVAFERVTHRGRDLPPALRRRIGFVFADPHAAFDPRLSVGHSLAEPLANDGSHSPDDTGDFIDEVLRAVGLGPVILSLLPGRVPARLLQRLAVARALVARPRLVILDDPVSRLDMTARGELLVLLNRLRADFGLTVLITTRELDIARIVADRAIVMDAGRVVESGTPAQLLGAPQHETTRQLVAANLPEIGITPVF